MSPAGFVPAPPSASVAFRARLAHLVSPLRRVRPRVPFFELAIHRTPTLALYRNLLRHAPDDNIRTRVQYLFRKHQHATGTEKTKQQLLKGYKWLDAFKKAREGDEKQREIFIRYSRLIAVRVEKHYWKRLARAELAHQAHLARRPILTGALIKATLFSPPLPRMKPQPPGISGMIRSRMRARDRRIAHVERLIEEKADLRAEAAFEEEGVLLEGQRVTRVYSGEAATGWNAPIRDTINLYNRLLSRDIARAKTPVSPALQATLLAARREKVANKTRERARERRGVVLPGTLRRARKGPPAHILVHMSPQERHLDRVVRGVGEVGYVGMIKRRMGVKLRDGGKGLARENGWDLEGEAREKVLGDEKAYWIEKMRRMERNVRLERG
ncbi:hypothetical protein C8F04DRAFT_1233093 [Mycena alexandri]|uniref:Complex 1 LYR protein domain-containing protein n=1 Tax=Mycena alexandri TaxID=1745969 RepID=A0AAD6X920_9AGAR|nr:hypothetical protein C8F04DRAFT_1233093 [Mycena alexandri]